MAQIVGGFFLPHVPLILAEAQAAQPEQAKRVHAAFDKIVVRLRDLRVDTVITIGADHYGLFGPHCVPQCLIGVGDLDGPAEPWLGLERGPVADNSPLAKHILKHGHEAGVDWAFATSFVLDHAAMVPYHLTTAKVPNVRTIPVYLNEAVEPLIPSRRAHEIGRQLLAAVESWHGDERVAVYGTGGISHWVGTAEMGRVNEDFDRHILELVEAGDVESLIAITDTEILEQAGNGAAEIKSWICAMGAMPGGKGDIIAYEAVREWVCGFGFAEFKIAA